MKAFVFGLITLPYRILNFIKFKFFGVSCGKNLTVWGSIVIKARRGSIAIGNNVRINSSYAANPVSLSEKTTLFTKNEGKIAIGNRVGISNAAIASMCSVTIEDDVLIGGGTRIWDTDFHSLRYEERMAEVDNDIAAKPILIKKGAFVGASAIVLKGVTIGEKAVVAAGSVVTKDIPDGEIWGGNPARFIRKTDNEPR